jgi:hypothetical protein
MVELNTGFEEGVDSGTAGPKTFAVMESEAAEGRPAQDQPAGSFQSAGSAPAQSSLPSHEGGPTGSPMGGNPIGGSPTGGNSEPPVTVIGDAAEGVRVAGQILRNATTARWPMYLRNVKQIFRAAPEPFDERRYGFGSLMDILRALQREGLIRLERDRRGGLRVFPGAAIQARPSSVPSENLGNEQQPTVAEPADREPGNSIDVQDDDADMEPQPGNQAIPIDTTAELLGRAKHRRPRTRAAAASPTTAAPRATRKAAAPRKAAAVRRPSRAKKPADGNK